MFLDATGNILRNIEGQKEPRLYSFVCHDKTNHSITPVAEFITTSHTQESIQQYVFTIKSYMKRELHNNYLPRLIVTDFSWPLINSECEVFNECDIPEYFRRSFAYLKDKNNQILKNSFPVVL